VFGGVWLGFGGKKETLEYMTGQFGPTARLTGADCLPVPRGPSAVDFINPSESAQFLSLFCPAKANRPLSSGGPSATQRFKPDRTALFLTTNGGPSAVHGRTVRLTKDQLSRFLSSFSNTNFD